MITPVSMLTRYLLMTLILMLALSYGGRTNFEGQTKDRYMRPVILDLLHIQTLIPRISNCVEPVSFLHDWDEWTED